MRILAARPCDYDYKTHEAKATGAPVDPDTLAAIEQEGEAVCRVEGEYNRVIWYAPWDAMDNEGQHYLAQVEG
jgi:hypothetical protein